MCYLGLGQLLLCFGHRLELLAGRPHLDRRQNQTQENLAQSCPTGNQWYGSVGGLKKDPTNPEHLVHLHHSSKIKKPYESGDVSSDLYPLWLTDPDADPGQLKKYGSYGSGSGTLVHLHYFSKIKSRKEVTKRYKSRFFLFLHDDEKIRIRTFH